MKRLATGMAATALWTVLVAQPALAQLVGLPVYFSPKGGTGLTFSGDFGRAVTTKVSGLTSPTHPQAIGGRVSLGLPIVTVGVGVASYNPKIITQRNETQFAGTAALKVFGSALVPVAISFQAGAGYLKQGSGTSAIKSLNVPIGLGVALNVPTPGASLEPWVAARVHLNAVSQSTSSALQTGYGVSGGLSLGLPIGLGAHVALDYASFGAKTSGLLNLRKTQQVTVGVGVHYSIKLPGLPGVPIVPGA